MSTRLATDDLHHHTDDGEEYILVDPRAMLLDLPDEPRREGRLLRGSQPPAPTAQCDPEIEWRTFLGAARQGEPKATSPFWHRWRRRFQHAWRGGDGNAPVE